MLLRLVAGLGLVALGYFVGRELKHIEPARKELKRARENGEFEALHKDSESGEDNNLTRKSTPK